MQDLSAQHFVQDVCRLLQPCTSVQTNPTSGLTLTATLWGAGGRQGQTSCRVVPANLRWAKRPPLLNMTRVLHKVLCRPALHKGRVLKRRLSHVYMMAYLPPSKRVCPPPPSAVRPNSAHEHVKCARTQLGNSNVCAKHTVVSIDTTRGFAK